MLIGEEAATAPRAEELMKRGRIYPHPYLQEWGNAPHCEMPHEEMQRIRAIEDRNEKNRAMHDWFRKNPSKILPLTPELVTLVEGLTGQKLGEMFGMGGRGAYQLEQKLLELAGLDPKTWGRCPVCKGEGLDPAVQEVYEAWKRTPPPEGEGYQLWETVSEGSPVSSVFPTEEQFIAYLISQGHSEKAARNFTRIGWTPSGLIVHEGPDANPDGSPKIYPNIDMCGLKDDTTVGPK
jgi:hypothetical protein